jgi:hypothetical protein
MATLTLLPHILQLNAINLQPPGPSQSILWSWRCVPRTVHNSFHNDSRHIFLSKVKVKLSLCLTKHHAMKTYWGSGDIALLILDLGTRWWVVSFTPQPLYPQGKNPWYQFDRRLGGPQSPSGRGGEEKNSQPPPGIEPQNPDRPALYRLHGTLRHPVRHLIKIRSVVCMRFALCKEHVKTCLQAALHGAASVRDSIPQVAFNSPPIIPTAIS